MNNTEYDIIYEEDSSEPEVEHDAIDLTTETGGDNEGNHPDKKIEGNVDSLDLVTMIEELPDDFPTAHPIIKEKIAPILATQDDSMIEHYIMEIKKKTNAVSKKAVSLVIDDARKKLVAQEIEAVEDEDPDPDPENIEPEVQELLDDILQDPLIFKRRIDFVNEMGVSRERDVIGMNFLTIDSSKISENTDVKPLALANCGMQGSGKSFPLFKCLKLYPKKSYHLISNSSQKAMYYINGGLKNRCLIFTEAFVFTDSSDSEISFAVRSLLSEGHVTYQYLGYDDEGRRVTKPIRLSGPTSLVTTSTHNKLESQLQDRMFKVHPNISSTQTEGIVENQALKAAGIIQSVDKNIIDAWKLFHGSLEPAEVVIPFALDVYNYLIKGGSLPVSTRRAFERVISTITTIVIFHQHRRERDNQGRIIAEIQDYAYAFQLIGDPFLESIGQKRRITDKRLDIIERKGPIQSKYLAKTESISTAALTPWIKERVETGVLTWCDENSTIFPDESSLNKAKHSGKAFIRIAHLPGLPSPYQLTGDSRWNYSGDLWLQFDLGIMDKYIDTVDETGDEANDTDAKLDDLTVNDQVMKNDGVKVLSEKHDHNNIFGGSAGQYKGLEKIFYNKEEELADEFGEALATPHHRYNQKESGRPIEDEFLSSVEGCMTV